MKKTEKVLAIAALSAIVPMAMHTNSLATNVEEVGDTIAPTITVKSEAEGTIGNIERAIYTKVSFKLHDDTAIDKVVINGVDKELSSAKWSDWNNVQVGKNGGIAGKNIIKVLDETGNESETYTFYLDNVAPTITVKDNTETEIFTIGNKETNTYKMVSFKLYDQYLIDKIIINGTEKDLTDNKWSDHNFVSVGKNGGIQGENVITLVDIMGNESSYTFYLDSSAPVITVKDNTDTETFTVGNKETNTYTLVSFKLYDEYLVDKIIINGTEKDLTDNKWSDHNFVSIGKNGGIEGENTITLVDVVGNETTYTFFLESEDKEEIKDPSENNTEDNTQDNTEDNVGDNTVDNVEDNTSKPTNPDCEKNKHHSKFVHKIYNIFKNIFWGFCGRK
ncbi:MAG: hypothetical protein IJE05_05600 [Clostridia bacterium]|nr:hypothetical protein [Clostridia bacterium]